MSKKIKKSAKELLAEGKALRLQLSFTEEEYELFDYIQSHPKMAKYVKGVIYRDMIASKGGNTGYTPAMLYTPPQTQTPILEQQENMNADRVNNANSNLHDDSRDNSLIKTPMEDKVVHDNIVVYVKLDTHKKENEEKLKGLVGLL